MTPVTKTKENNTDKKFVPGMTAVPPFLLAGETMHSDKSYALTDLF